MQGVARFEGKSTLYTWLFRIAINLAISHRRSNHTGRPVSLDGDREEEADSVNRQAAGLHRQLAQKTEDDPAITAERQMEYERLQAALARLDPEFKAVIILRDVEECDYDQIAAILDVPVGTIKIAALPGTYRSAGSPEVTRSTAGILPAPYRRHLACTIVVQAVRLHRTQPAAPGCHSGVLMSNNQEELQQRIAAYIDGELSPADAARLEVYLANTDPALADRIVGMVADKVQLRALPRPKAPADITTHIMEQIGAQTASSMIPIAPRPTPGGNPVVPSPRDSRWSWADLRILWPDSVLRPRPNPTWTNNTSPIPQTPVAIATPLDESTFKTKPPGR